MLEKHQKKYIECRNTVILRFDHNYIVPHTAAASTSYFKMTTFQTKNCKYGTYNCHNMSSTFSINHIRLYQRWDSSHGKIGFLMDSGNLLQIKFLD